MKRCALCKSTASIFCDSDSASLCWTCDAKVHSANFLVARHSRSLLCQICQSPTPWSASGNKLWPSTTSRCGQCVAKSISVDQDDIDHKEEVVGTCNNSRFCCSVDGDKFDNRGLTRSSKAIPPSVSSSSSEVVFPGDGCGFRKRKHRNVEDITHEDEISSSSVSINYETPSSTTLKQFNGDETRSFELSASREVETVTNTIKLRNQNMISGAYMHAPLLRTVKSRKTLEFDLNLLATE